MIPIGPAPVIKHILAQHVELKRRVDGVAERVEDRLHVAGDIRVVSPHVGHRQRQVFGKRAGPVDADPLGVLAQMPAAGQAIAAPAANDVPFAADDLANVEILDVRARLDDLSHKLVADHHRHGNRLLCPGIPGFDMNIGTADPGAQDLDEHVVDPDPREPAPRRAKGRAWPLFSRVPASSPSRISSNTGRARTASTGATRSSNMIFFIEG